MTGARIRREAGRWKHEPGRCCACGRRGSERTLILIGGMPLHLRCALDRRIAATR